MLKKILEKARTHRTFKDLNIVFIENVLTKGISFLLFILITRTLGPEKYGVYSLVTFSILFLVPMFDFGMENTAVRFSSRHLGEKDTIFGIYLVIKTAILVVLSLLILLFPHLIPRILNKPEAQKYILIILAGFAIENYRLIVVAHYQATEKFFIRARINAGTFLLRLLSIFILLRLSIMNVRIITVCFALAGVPFLLLFWRHFADFIRAFLFTRLGKSLFSEILHYEKWLFLASIPVKIMTTLDFYVAARFLPFRELGFYGSAMQLINALSIIPFVLGTVFLPKLSKYSDFSGIKSFIRNVVKLGIPVTIFLIPIIFFSKYFVTFFLGSKFLNAYPIFQILLIAFVFALWNVMLGTTFYGLGKSKYMAIGAFIQMITFIALVQNFALKWGALGIAWSMVCANILYLAVSVYFLVRVVYVPVKKTGHL